MSRNHPPLDTTIIGTLLCKVGQDWRELARAFIVSFSSYVCARQDQRRNMHEFSVFSQIPSSRHEQVLSILAGVTAAQPVRINEQTLIYRQLIPPPTVGAKKAPGNKRPNNQSLFHTKLIRDVQHGEHAPWLLRAEETPLPGVQNVISRPVTEQLATDAMLERFRRGVGWYDYIDQYISIGYRFVQHNVIIKVTQVYAVPEGTGALEALDAPLPVLGDCRLVDTSGCYLLEASIRIEDGSNAKLVEQATGELISFKKQLDGVVDLKVPERLALDSKIKGT